jgi:L-lactate dehydrogenase complex protein LldG
MTSESRQAILSSIREHLAASERFDAEGLHSQPVPDPTSSKSADDRNDTVINIFQQALEAVSGHCSIVHTHEEAARAIQQIVERKASGPPAMLRTLTQPLPKGEEREVVGSDSRPRRVAVSDSSLVKRILGLLKTEAVFLEAPNQSELFDCDMGITTAQWAIAETGTLVLESEHERHRLTSLVPPVHVAIIQASGIRRTMSEILELIKNPEVGLSRTVTFITGPSRTSDIELTLAIGVHGPGELHVIVIDDVAQPA